MVKYYNLARIYDIYGMYNLAYREMICGPCPALWIEENHHRHICMVHGLQKTNWKWLRRDTRRRRISCFDSAKGQMWYNDLCWWIAPKPLIQLSSKFLLHASLNEGNPRLLSCLQWIQSWCITDSCLLRTHWIGLYSVNLVLKGSGNPLGLKCWKIHGKTQHDSLQPLMPFQNFLQSRRESY